MTIDFNKEIKTFEGEFMPKYNQKGEPAGYMKQSKVVLDFLGRQSKGIDPFKVWNWGTEIAKTGAVSLDKSEAAELKTLLDNDETIVSFVRAQLLDTIMDSQIALKKDEQSTKKK